MANPLVYLVDMVFSSINFLLMAWIILSLLESFNLVNSYHPLVRKISLALSRLFEPVLQPIRRYMPDLGGLDLSPVVLMIVLNFIQYTIHWFLLVL